MRNFLVETIPYGLDTDIFQPRDKAEARARFGVPSQAKVLLFVSQWLDDPYKGMPTLLNAIERLQSIPDIFLLILGRGEVSGNSEIPRLALGSINDEQKMSYVYSAADLFLLPSLADNFPNTALESLACGLPIVGSDVGGIPEMVRDGHTGLLVRRDDAAGFANAATLLLNDSERLRTMSVHCREVALQEYTL
ncbi:MAG TPA: glycosyltransferase, partial [Candidatus Sulfotelmatobacter sp.]|nr:glycosyltransferase [Candidatus Sulfotelmatobacter sp.]